MKLICFSNFRVTSVHKVHPTRKDPFDHPPWSIAQPHAKRFGPKLPQVNAIANAMSKRLLKSRSISTMLWVTMAFVFTGTSCSSGFWQTDELGMQHRQLEGSWRALTPTTGAEAWLAGSDGLWAHIQEKGNTTTLEIMHGAGVTVGDTVVPLHYRSLVVTGDAVLGMSIASPAHIQRANITEDGGLELPRVLAWTEGDSAVFMDAMLHLGQQCIIAMGDPTDGCLHVVRSEDDGRTWTRVACADSIRPGVPAARSGEAAFAASNGNLAAVGDTVWMLSGGGASRVYRSTDRGISWQVFDTPLQQGGTMTGGFSMDFADAQHGIIWGGNWAAKDDQTQRGAVTQDGGQTWALISENAGPGYASSVRYRPGSQGRQLALVGSPGGLDLSDDGGQSWRHVSDSAFYAARFSPDGQTLWLAGNGKIGRISSDNLGW